ncbi:MAG: cytochrome c, partial [Gammaproteobacteria bacterium]|nr:cytochrome c [Gammaproteobacteria bacterium]
MKKQKIILVALALISVGIAYALFAVPPVSSEVSLPTSEEAIARGAYLVSAGGCISCHRAEGEETAETFSGGFALETDFGTFYAPNITPDAET